MEHVSALLVTKLLFGFILKESSERKNTHRIKLKRQKMKTMISIGQLFSVIT